MNLQAYFDDKALSFFPQTWAYICTQDDQRAGHHTYVALRKIRDLCWPLEEISEAGIATIDERIKDYLILLDREV